MYPTHVSGPGPSGATNIIIWIGAILIGIALFAWKRFSIKGILFRNSLVPDSPDDAAIISYYSAGHWLSKGTKSELHGQRFTTYFATPNNPDLAFTDDTAAICVLDLPFNTQTHLLGLSKEHKIDRVQFGNFLRANGMEKVDLEGDFPDYFDIYAAQGQETQVRQVLNPEAMGFVVDFCRSHFWEINSSELYIAVTDKDSANDKMIEDSQQFIDQIKPALLPGEPGAAPVHHEVAYDDYDGPGLPCPICQKQMVVHDSEWQSCPDGHGILLNGRDLSKVHHGEITISLDNPNDTSHGTLTCPNCHHQMTAVSYEDSTTQIDSCENCPFRWLDANEIPDISKRPAVPIV